MRTERFGTRLSTSSEAALAQFEVAAFRILSHRPQAEAALVEALAADPQLTGAWARRGLCHVRLGRSAGTEQARAYLVTAKAVMDGASASDDERALVRALEVGVHGGLRRAAEILENKVHGRPQLLLFAKLAHALRFMAGDRDRLTVGVETVLNSTHAGADGTGFMLGCLAFACEERGDFRRAEQLGLLALAQEPEDAWAMHAVSHVHEMTGRTRDGLDFIEKSRPIWSQCNNFSLHMSWHKALFQAEERRFDDALQVFDDEIWPHASEDFRDISNAVSLLRRLELVGVQVAGRWQSVAQAAAAHVQDKTYTFASLHNLVALLSAGRLNEAADLVATMERPGAPGNDQEHVMRRVGRPIARLLLDEARGRAGRIDLQPLLSALRDLGGSAAQRDLFVRILIHHASRRADQHALAELLAFRRQLKKDDLFVEVVAGSHPHPVRYTA